MIWFIVGFILGAAIGFFGSLIIMAKFREEQE